MGSTVMKFRMGPCQEAMQRSRYRERRQQNTYPRPSVYCALYHSQKHSEWLLAEGKAHKHQGILLWIDHMCREVATKWQSLCEPVCKGGCGYLQDTRHRRGFQWDNTPSIRVCCMVTQTSWGCMCVFIWNLHTQCMYIYIYIWVRGVKFCMSVGPTFKPHVWNLPNLMVPIKITLLLPQYKKWTGVWICANQWCTCIPSLPLWTTSRINLTILIIKWVHTMPTNLQRPGQFLPKFLQSNTINQDICKGRPNPENYLYCGTKCKEAAPIKHSVAFPPGFSNPCHRHPISMHPDWNSTPPPILTSFQGTVALTSPNTWSLSVFGQNKIQGSHAYRHTS